MSLLSKSIALGLFLALGIKAVIFGASLDLVLFSAIVGLLFFGLEIKQRDRVAKEIEAKLDERLKVLEESKKYSDAVLSDVKTSISSLRAAKGFNPVNHKMGA